MERMGLRGDQRVTIRSEVGEMAGVRARPFEIRAGNCLMYFPEANVLVPTRSDPRSKTPAFKSVRVTVEPTAESFVPVTVDRAVRTGERARLKAC
jgi:anaerobic selenocysteine-containing dehydrogenase